MADESAGAVMSPLGGDEAGGEDMEECDAVDVCGNNDLHSVKTACGQSNSF